jgi:LuxR family transcriptional regulator, maltose regulon positive regulatory protein
VIRASRSKAAVPVLPPDFLSRPALLRDLDRGEDCALTLVCAPPGYGKTLLLADWVRRRDVPCAWVNLDEEDDDPRRLWAAVLAALTTCPSVPASSRLHGLVVPRTAVGVEFLTDLLEALTALPTRIRLVLDDAHHLRSREALQGLQLLLRHRPSTVRLVLASRFDLALPIARLRLEERLCELRTQQLRFSAEETATLADLIRLHLTDRQTAVLHERTGGWVAGIRLAAMPLRGHPEPDLFLADFSGDERPVADYLAGEVLAHISDEEAELLRRTSIADPVPTPLAETLSGRADAADMLGALERTTGLVVASGDQRTEFRIQELMRSYLSADLYRHGPALAARLHRSAAMWWGDQGRPVTALRHAARAADDTLVTALLHRWAPELVARGEHSELRRALAVAEASGSATDPWLPLVSAQLHLGNGEIGAARVEVRRAGGMGAGPDDGDLAHFRAATSGLAGMDGPAPEATTAPADPALAALTLAGRSAAGMSPARDGGPATAATVLGDLEAALVVARDRDLGFLELQCLYLIGAAASTASDMGHAAAAATAAIAAATTHGWQDSWWTAKAHAVLAHACLMRGDPVRAVEVSVEGLRGSPSEEDPVLRFALRSTRGGALFDIGDRGSGLLELQEAHAQLGATPVPLELAVGAALLEHRAALLLGFHAAAATSMGRLLAEGSASAEVTLMKAWTDAAAGSPADARARVVPLLDGSLRPTLASTVVEAWLVEIWGALRSGDRPAARHALQSALAHAEPLDLLRPFALAGQGLRVLLVDQLGGARDPDAFAYRCLAVRRRAHRPLAPPLSAREGDVLAQLVSLSNLGEIAEELQVSVNTVKSHVRAIYGKLGVNTRRTAVLTALERGLLT